MSRRYGAFLFKAAVGLLLCLAPSFTRAQVTVVRNGVQVDEAKVRVLFNTACRVVAEEFHLPNPGDTLFRVTLVLGDAKDTVIGDELHKTYAGFAGRPRLILAIVPASIGRASAWVSLEHLLLHCE
jgi:hypothetical protein